MRSRALVALCAMTLLIAACGATGGPGSTASVEGIGQGGESQQPPDPASSTEVQPTPPPDGEAVVLHGSFVGQRRDSLVTADLTVEFELRWNAAEDDIHDINAFAFNSGELRLF